MGKYFNKEDEASKHGGDVNDVTHGGTHLELDAPHLLCQQPVKGAVKEVKFAGLDFFQHKQRKATKGKAKSSQLQQAEPQLLVFKSTLPHEVGSPKARGVNEEQSVIGSGAVLPDS